MVTKEIDIIDFGILTDILVRAITEWILTESVEAQTKQNGI